MGLTYVTVALSDLAEQGSPYEARFLVDTSANDCLAPRDRLLAAGIKPQKKAVYELANGASVECEVGFAKTKFIGDETVGEVIFGPVGVEPILGVIALGSMGVVFDPVTKNLKRLHAKHLK